MVYVSRSNMLDEDLITIITTVYNSTVLWETITSVLHQTYGKIQYIVIDDGSEDFNISEVETFIEKYKKPNLVDYTIIRNIKNIGTVKTLNKALKLACGNYIFNLAGDDVFYDEEVIKDWVAEFKRTGALVLTGMRAVYDVTLTNLEAMMPSPEDIEILRTRSSEQIFKRLIKSNFIFGCCTAKSKMLIDQIGFYDEDYVLLEDYPSMLMLSRNSIVIEYWNRPVVKYRLGGVSAPERFSPKYERDSDLVLEKEILPYVRSPVYAKLTYYRWKFMQKEYGRFLNCYRKLKARKQYYFLPFICIRYPIPVLGSIKYKIKKIINRT